MSNVRLSGIWYGGDYNPDQWPKDIWLEDMRLFRLANITVATLPVFSWAKLQPSEEKYDFGWLDEILGLLADNGIAVCLATSTAAHPAWMARRYPDILRVDFSGRKRNFGHRHNSCPHSPTYRKYAPKLAGRLAERYRNHPALLAWHVSNEFGGYCYCENCARAFRAWLKERYGTLEHLNACWYTSFWGHTFYEWEEIVPPNLLSEHVSEDDPTETAFQGLSLDYNRFMSGSLLDCFRLEKQAIREHSNDVPVTTNFMAAFKALDYNAWANEQDIISWDSYPSNRTHPADIALRHAQMRGLKGGKPFLLMEQTPSQVNWQDYNALKRPGVMRLWSYQAIAHGADGVLFFQLRQSAGASEKFHGAVISHAGHENTRVFQESAELGAELSELGDETVGAIVPARAAILFDWENWWALELSSGPTKDLKYYPQIEKYHRAFWEQNIPVDVIGPDHDLNDYDLLVMPTAYMLRSGYGERLKRFVTSGGTLLCTFFSGIVDENDLVQLGGYPAAIRDLLGVWVEEHDPLFPDMSNAILVPEGVLAGRHPCALLCERIHSEGATVVGTFESNFYAGMPGLTRNRYGEGEAWYVASDMEPASLALLISELCSRAAIEPLLETPDGVEAAQRAKGGNSLLFLLNHNDREASVNLGSARYRDLLCGTEVTSSIELPAYGVSILKHI